MNIYKTSIFQNNGLLEKPVFHKTKDLAAKYITNLLSVFYLQGYKNIRPNKFGYELNNKSDKISIVLSEETVSESVSTQDTIISTEYTKEEILNKFFYDYTIFSKIQPNLAEKNLFTSVTDRMNWIRHSYLPYVQWNLAWVFLFDYPEITEQTSCLLLTGYLLQTMDDIYSTKSIHAPDNLKQLSLKASIQFNYPVILTHTTEISEYLQDFLNEIHKMYLDLYDYEKQNSTISEFIDNYIKPEIFASKYFKLNELKQISEQSQISCYNIDSEIRYHVLITLIQKHPDFWNNMENNLQTLQAQQSISNLGKIVLLIYNETYLQKTYNHNTKTIWENLCKTHETYTDLTKNPENYERITLMLKELHEQVNNCKNRIYK